MKHACPTTFDCLALLQSSSHEVCKKKYASRETLARQAGKQAAGKFAAISILSYIELQLLKVMAMLSVMAAGWLADEQHECLFVVYTYYVYWKL